MIKKGKHDTIDPWLEHSSLGITARCHTLGCKVGIQLDASLAGQVFDFIDRNGNGKISWEEVWEAARPSVDEVLQVLKAIREQRGLSIERLLRQHDSSGDDKLAFSEFQKLLQALSIDIDEKTAAGVFKRLDRDGDQQLSLRTLFGGDSRGGTRFGRCLRYNNQ